MGGGGGSSSKRFDRTTNKAVGPPSTFKFRSKVEAERKGCVGQSKRKRFDRPGPCGVKGKCPSSVCDEVNETLFGGKLFPPPACRGHLAHHQIISGKIDHTLRPLHDMQEVLVIIE